jgi:hypothetical protein
LVQSSELWLKLLHRHSLAQEVHKGSYVTRVNLWACLFHGPPCQKPDPVPRSLWKIRHDIPQGSLVLCVRIVTVVFREDVLRNLCQDEDPVAIVFALLTIRVEKRESPTSCGDDCRSQRGERCLPNLSERGTGRMEVVFDSPGAGAEAASSTLRRIQGRWPELSRLYRRPATHLDHTQPRHRLMPAAEEIIQSLRLVVV